MEKSLRREILPKVILSLVAAVAVSVSLGFLTIYTLRSNLLLSSEVELGYLARSHAERISSFVDARAREISLLARSQAIQDYLTTGNDFLHLVQQLEFLGEKFGGIYVLDNQNRVCFGVRDRKIIGPWRESPRQAEAVIPHTIPRDILPRPSSDSHPPHSAAPNSAEGSVAEGTSVRMIEFVKGGFSYSVSLFWKRVEIQDTENFTIVASCPSELWAVPAFVKGKGGDFAFMVNGSGRIMAHPRGTQVGSDFSRYIWLRNRLIEQGGSQKFTMDGEDFLIAAAPVKTLKGLICVVRPFTDLERDLGQIKNIAFLVAFGLFSVVAMVAWFIFSLLVRHERDRLSAQIRLTMADQAMKYSADLEEKNLELSRANAELAELHGQILDEKNKVVSMVDTITDAIVVTDNDFRVTFTNQRARALFPGPNGSGTGASIVDFTGQPWIHEAMLTTSKTEDPENESDRPRSGEEVWIEKPIFSGGNRRVVKTAVLPLLSGSGERRGFVAIFHDVTRERELDRMKSEFLSMISHELRTPLASVKGTVELMLGGMLGSLSDEQRKFLKVMLGESNRLIRLINDILDLERLETGKFGLNPEVFDLVSAISAAVDSARGMAAEKEIDIVMDESGYGPSASPDGKGRVEVCLDSDKFRQIMLNLLNNAVRYSETGPITVFIETGADQVEITVRDRGIGIARDRFEAIFDKFYQVDSSVTRKAGGSGLGLPITRRLVELMGGRIWVDSVLGEGSEFHLSLPRRLSGMARLQDPAGEGYPEALGGAGLIPEKTSSPEGSADSAATASSVSRARQGLHGPPPQFDSARQAAASGPPGEKSRSIDGLEVLVIEDDPTLLEVTAAQVREWGCSVRTAGNAEAALFEMERRAPDIIVLDLGLPDRNGLELIASATALCPGAAVVVVTGQNRAESAVEALGLGACDYLVKPFDPSRFREGLARAAAGLGPRIPRGLLSEELRGKCDTSSLSGSSRAMARVRDLIAKVARVDDTVLITGESGTGKELVARAIHSNSPRALRPFIPVNCGALSEGLLESELFGFEKGAFTGADLRKDGLFRAADGGTLFLDEIGEAPLSVQVKLLRVLQEGQVLPVGATAPVKVDVRLLAATNRDLSDMVLRGLFRQDLLFRIDVLNISVPPLRERAGDIAELIRAIFRKEPGMAGIEITPETVKTLMEYDWPGNVRELENVVRRAALVSGERVLKPSHLPDHIAGPARLARAVSAASTKIGDGSYREEKAVAMDLFDRAYIEKLLRQAGGNVSAAARAAGMHQKNLHVKIRSLGLEPAVFKPEDPGAPDE